VELGNDLGRLLPVELVKLRHPRLHALALRDLLERKAMQYALTGKEKLGKGPLVVLLDRSGSMKGDADTWSISVALALLGIAHEERRTFAVLAFSNQVFYQVVIKPGEKLPEAALNLECDGGTEIDTAMSTGLSIIESNPGALHEADLVLVTDGCSASDRAPELRQRARALGACVLGIGIGVAKDQLTPWADIVETITSLDGLGEQVADALFAGTA
jgi:uncharacterized protein with von Willebrand factor type A (vWA) domain